MASSDAHIHFLSSFFDNQAVINNERNHMTQNAIIHSALSIPAGRANAIGHSTSASTPELQYANLCKADPSTACLSGKLYRWNRDHWQVQTAEQCEQDAFA